MCTGGGCGAKGSALRAIDGEAAVLLEFVEERFESTDFWGAPWAVLVYREKEK
jgi:hypothetical protein